MNSEPMGSAKEIRQAGEIEQLKNMAENIHSDICNLNGRLYDLRQRLIGIDEGTGVGDASPDTPQPVRAEVHEVGHTLQEVCDVINTAKHNLAALERL